MADTENKFYAKWILFFVIIFMLTNGGCSRNNQTKNKILSQADKIALVTHHVGPQYERVYDIDNHLWNQTLSEIEQDSPEDAARYKGFLERRNYQAIYYNYKKSTVVGGTLWVFIDKKTGDVITFISEQ